MSDFASNLKKLRKSKKMTQEELALNIGVGKSTISMYESGAREPNFETLEIIADYFNVNLDLLVTGSKNNESNENIYGNHQNNLEYFADDKELLSFYKDMHDSENLKILFDTGRELTPEELEKVLRYMKMVMDGSL